MGKLFSETESEAEEQEEEEQEEEEDDQDKEYEENTAGEYFTMALIFFHAWQVYQIHLP